MNSIVCEDAVNEFERCLRETPDTYNELIIGVSKYKIPTKDRADGYYMAGNTILKPIVIHNREFFGFLGEIDKRAKNLGAREELALNTAIFVITDTRAAKLHQLPIWDGAPNVFPENQISGFNTLISGNGCHFYGISTIACQKRNMVPVDPGWKHFRSLGEGCIRVTSNHKKRIVRADGRKVAFPL